MKPLKLGDMTVDELVDRFAELGIAQDAALLYDEKAKFRGLFDQMNDIDAELRARGRDARHALLQLYDHTNIQVRLQAAIWTLGIAPSAGRKVIEAIKQSGHFPQAGDAGMALRALDDGIFKPD